MRKINRRNLLIAAAGLAGGGALAGCSGVAGGGGGGGGSDDAAGSVRFAFWGNNVRMENYQDAFDHLMESDPDVTLDTEFADYNAFQERMTTQMAGGNVADIFWIPSASVMSYYANDLYRPLSDVSSLDLSDFSEQDLRDFELAGELNTMPHGIFVPVLRSNVTLAEEDGVTIPDSWTWDELAEFARDYSANSAEGRFALPYNASHDLTFEAWLRQHGEELWTEDGQVGFSEDGLASWIDWWEQLRAAGATPEIGAQDGVEPSWEDVGNRTLMWTGNSNHIVDDATMFPDQQFALHHVPEAADAPAGHQYLYFPRMAMYQGISDEQAELAGQVMTFCTSNPVIHEYVGLTMGAPVSPKVSEAVREFASDYELQMLDVVTEDREIERTPRYEAPPGTSTWRTEMTRALEQVTLGEVSVAQGAAGLIAEINRGIEREAD